MLLKFPAATIFWIVAMQQVKVEPPARPQDPPQLTNTLGHASFKMIRQYVHAHGRCKPFARIRQPRQVGNLKGDRPAQPIKLPLCYLDSHRRQITPKRREAFLSQIERISAPATAGVKHTGTGRQFRPQMPGKGYHLFVRLLPNRSLLMGTIPDPS